MRKFFAVTWYMMPWIIVANILVTLSYTPPIVIYNAVTGIIFFVYAVKKVFFEENDDDVVEE